MCKPSDDATAFIDFGLLDACAIKSWKGDIGDQGDQGAISLAAKSPASPSSPASPLADSAQQGALYLGVDIGRHHDLTVMWLAEDAGGVLVTKRVEVLRNQPFRVQVATLYAMLDLPNLRRCCIDKNGMGEQMAEDARHRYGYKVEPTALTNQSKESMAYALRSRMEDRTLRIPDDRAVFADFRGIRKTVTAAGNIRFDGERTKDGHSDRFWAAALCVEAASSPNSLYCPPPTNSRRSLAVRRRRGSHA
jgi:phage FluMu gp28-like protein